MIFYCKDCNNEFEINDQECSGYHNWKCPNCSHIAQKKDSLSLGIIWKCDTGTVSKGNKDTSANPKCATCPNAAK